MATPVGDSIPVLVTGNNGNGTLTEEFISGLVQGGSWQLAGPRTITYSLDLNYDGPTQAWSQPWSDAIAGAFGAWSSVANVNFVLAGTPNAVTQNQSMADIAVALAPGAGGGFLLGFGVFPDPEFADLILDETGYSRDVYPRLEGDIVFDSAHEIFQFLHPGSPGFEVLIHEIGHALGLKHPGDDGGNGRPTFSALGIANYDLPQHTLMTTLNASNGTTPGPLDILAIQHIYGANMTYHAGNDVYFIDDGNMGVMTIWDAGGTDTIDASDEIFGVTLDLRPASVGNVRNIVIAYNVTIENAIGGAGDDLITGNGAANNLNGGAGNDTLDGGLGADTLAGGIGNDTYTVDVASDVVTELAGEGTDTLRPSILRSLSATFENLVLLGAGNLTGLGNGYANSITGNSGNNVLNGGGGNDTLAGSGGSDTLNGGAGNDVYINPGGDVVTEAAGGGMDTVQSSANATLAANLESLILTGNAGTSGTGNALANRLQGNNGHNRLNGGGGNDTLIGGGGNDTLIGGGGNDTLDGSFGNDSLSGGAGNDRYQGVSASDVVIETPDGGVDTVEFSGSTTLGANLENLVLTYSDDDIVSGTGNDLANRLDGDSRHNRLDGVDGNDTLYGGQGNDTLIGGAGNDFLSGGIEDDVLTGGEGNDTLDGDSVGFGNDTLIGGAGDDVMVGRTFNDVYVVDSAGDVVIEQAGGGTDLVLSSVTYALAANMEVELLTLTGSGDLAGTGNNRSNRITGNAGDNALDGGAGRDTLVGGAGNDTYVLNIAGPTTYFSFSGEPGDYISQGRSHYVEFDDGPFSIDATDQNFDDLVDTVSVYANDWRLEFSTRNTGLPMQPGTFLEAVRYPFETTGHPGLNISGNGRGSNTLTGQFTVTEATFDYSGASPEVVRFAVSYEQHSEGAEPALTGKLVINGPVIAGDTVIELAGNGTDAVLSAFSYTLPQHVENLTLTGTGAINGAGNGSNNVLTGNAGNNVMNGAGGADTLRGMGGNDTLVWNAQDTLFDGGTGIDTLRVTGGNLNLTTIDNTKILNVETINLTGGGDNLLALDTLDVLELSSTTNTLRVLGDAGDAINIVPTFTDQGLFGSFHRYTFGGATLLVDPDITSVA